MRRRIVAALIAITTSGSCGGPLPTDNSATGSPTAIAQVRPFDEERGTDLTVHTGLPDDQSVRLEVRLFAQNVPTDTRRVLNTALLETNIELDDRNAIFGRAEYVTRTAEELALVGSISSEVEVGSLALGFARRVARLRGIGAWLGGRGNVDIVPEQLRLFYGSRTPAGFLVYLQIKP